MPDMPPKPLDYADPQVESTPPHSGRKETIDLFREPPAITRIGVGDIIIWVVSFLGLLALLVFFVSRWLNSIH